MHIHHILNLLISSASALFTENLNLVQHPNGKVLATFNFTRSSITLEETPNLGYDLVPRALKEIIVKSQVREFLLTFTKGRWYESRYGYAATAPSGANLVGWFTDDNYVHSAYNSSVETRWEYLVNGLAGLTCSSLNFMTSTVTWQPSLIYTPALNKIDHNLVARAASLPREIVCTENLTPWAKLLPCGTKAGISQLLNGYKLFDADYQSLSIQLIPACSSTTNVTNSDCKSLQYTLIQTVTVLLDPIRTTNTKSWSTMSLFDREITRDCPHATRTTIFTSVSNSKTGNANSSFTPAVKDIKESDPAKITMNNFLIKEGKIKVKPSNYPLLLQVQHSYPTISQVDNQLVPITITRRLGGMGQEKGRLIVKITNTGNGQKIVYTESIPWIIKLQLHTMSITTHTINLDHESLPLKPELILYRPSKDRVRPTVLELILTVPTKSTLVLQIEHEYAFLKTSEHLPDANYGFEIGSSILKFNSTSIYTSSELVRLPTPDFSMPYNVITLSCTVMALYFGGVFNILMRKWMPIKLE